MQRPTTPMSDYSKCTICIGTAIAAIGLYATIVVPLIAAEKLEYGIDLGSILRNISVIIAVIAALPYIVKLYKYYRWRPEIHILYHESLITSAENLSNEVEIRIEYAFPETNQKTLKTTQRLIDDNLVETDRKGHPFSLTYLRGEEFLLFPGQRHDLVELEPETITRVRIYPKVHLSEFGWPRFYGDVELKPIDRIIRLDPDGNLVGSNEEWIEKEYGSRESIMSFFK